MAVLDPEPKYTIDRYQNGGGLTPIRIRTRDQWSPLGAVLIYPELSSRESDCPYFIGRSK